MKRALTALLSLALAAFALLSLSPAASADTPGAKKAQAPAAAQAAGLQLAEFCGSPGNPCRIFGYVHTDANYQGVRSRLVTLDRGDCDGSGYTFTFGWGSLGRGTSSISRSYDSRGCNAAAVTTTFGGVVGMCLSKAYIGNAANDLVAKVKVYHSNTCPA